MANIPPIQVKRSETLGAVPTQADLEVGELAVNTADSRIFTKDSGGNVVSLGWNYHTGPDSDATFYVDSEGLVYATGYPEADYTIVAKTAGNELWQNAETLADAKPGTKVNVYREATGGDMWTVGEKTNTDLGWDGNTDQPGIVLLNYGGVASYAYCPFFFNATYRIQTAYISGGDHAGLARLNNYWIWQVFDTEVDIGNGTSLGTFDNGRFAGEFYAESRVTFYDKDHNILADQVFNNSAFATNTINVTGNITGCKTIMIRGNAGEAFNPGINEINFYVNGSTAYPTTTQVTDQKWGGAYKNVATGINLSDSDEVIVLYHVSSTAAVLVNGVVHVTGTTDWCLNATTDPSNQAHIFWFNRPWTIGGGTFANGRVAYPGQFWGAVKFEYYNSDNVKVLDRSRTYSGYSASNDFIPYRDVSKIIMTPSSASNNHPAIQMWYPNLCWIGSFYPNSTAISEPEVWIKGSSVPQDAIIDGVGTTRAWYKIAEVI